MKIYGPVSITFMLSSQSISGKQKNELNDRTILVIPNTRMPGSNSDLLFHLNNNMVSSDVV